MFGKFSKYAVMAMTMVLSLVGLAVPALAFSPATGDGTELLLPIMGGLLGISAILILVFVVLSKKKK